MSLVVGLTPYCDVEAVKGLVKPYGLPESNAFVQLSSRHDVELLEEHLLSENASLIIVWSRFERLVEAACNHHLVVDESFKDWLLVGHSIDKLARRYRKQIRLLDMGPSVSHCRWIAKSFFRENPAYSQIESRLLAMSVNSIEDSEVLMGACLEDLISFISDQCQSSVADRATIDTLKTSVDEKNIKLVEFEEENSLIISDLHRVQETLEETFKDKQKILADHDQLAKDATYITQEKDKISKKLEQLMSEKSSVINENKKLQVALKEQADQLKKKAIDATKMSSDLEGLKKELLNLKSELLSLKEISDKKTSQLDELEEENSLIISELHRVQEALEKAVTDNRSYYMEKEQLSDNYHKLQLDFNELTKSKVYLERNLMLVQSDMANKSLLQKFKKRRKLVKQAELIESSGYFSAQWYLEEYKDVAEHKRFSARPALHYLTIGAFEGRNPSPDFNSEAYLTANQDVFQNGFNPLIHYILHGKLESRSLE